jgi:eukaryotic-like serine/threonine-protein kinase
VPVAGTLIEGKYEILEKIKEGGMGTIYKVRHRLLDEVRVVKVMRPQIGSDEELKRRFTQEAKTATRLKHPNIGGIIDFALDSDGMAYIVMEFIDGVNLAELLRASGTPGVPMTLELAHQALLALGFLHRKSVVHRDVAPDNLMLTYDEDGRPQLKLIDLGIAKPLDNTINLTSTGVFLGKLKYSSPEQLGGLAAGETLDGRSDVYSLGVVLYELLTGRLPFPGDSPRELLAAHLFKEPIPFSVTDPTNRVPDPVRGMVMKAMDKERGRRFASAEEFDREILALQQNLAPFYDPDATHRILAKVRETKGLPKDSVTPSAQDRLDRHFLAQGTPTPLSTTKIPDPMHTGEWEETVASPIGGTVPPVERRRFPVAAAVLAAAAAIIVAILALTSGKPATSRRDESGPRASPPTPPAVAAVLPPTAVPEAPSPAVPTEAPPEEPTAPPAVAAPEDTDRIRLAADESRARSRSARGAADRARAPERAAALYESARSKEREGVKLAGAERYAAAAASFDNATALFRQAESWSRTAPARPPERVAALPPAREPTAVPPPTRPAAVAVPTRVPEEPKPAPVKPAEAPVRVRSEEDRVRDAVALYVQAQNALDVALYARIYPSLAGERRRMVENAFGSLKSQTLELDIRKVTVDGSHATVSGYERRAAVPRVGGEQRDARERVIRLEKRGDGWVITELR